MRLIDVDALTKAIGSYVVDDAKLSFNKLYENEDLIKVFQLVFALPIVDAVPVIRCKDCMYYDGYDCNEMQGMVDPTADGFCSKAERR